MKKVVLTWRSKKGNPISQTVWLLDLDEKLYIKPEDGGVPTNITMDDLIKSAEVGAGKNVVLFEDDEGVFGVQASDIISIEEVV